MPRVMPFLCAPDMKQLITVEVESLIILSCTDNLSSDPHKGSSKACQACITLQLLLRLILPHGTGYITDLGMTGPMNSALGVDPAQSIALFRGELTSRFKPAQGPCWLCGAVFTVESETGRCEAAEQIIVTEDQGL